MLSEEVKRYEALTGKSSVGVPISRLGGYLDGYEKGREDAVREIEEKMYHEAFELDHEADGMQKWDGGNWIRYKLFENVLEHINGAVE